LIFNKLHTNKLLPIAINASILAGKKIVEWYEKDSVDVEWKADNSPLTIADKEAHQVIFSILSPIGLPVLSEEGKEIPYSERKDWETYWLIDPLDGTKEFLGRNGEFTVNIALIHKKQPILGVVYVPVSRMLYFADASGAFKIQADHLQPENLYSNAVALPTVSKRSNYVVIGSRSHSNRETEKFIESLDLEGKQLDFIAVGSSLKLCMVAEGIADVYPRLGPTMEWDTAAGHAIANYAGKSVTVFDTGKTMLYNKENLLNPWFIVN
jgi:3'(2'), 5'-bisphosphate nucleotidase